MSRESNGEKTVVSTMLLEQLNLNPSLTSYQKNKKQKQKPANLIWIVDLNAKAKTTKFPEENMEENFCELRLGKDFLESI